MLKIKKISNWKFALIHTLIGGFFFTTLLKLLLMTWHFEELVDVLNPYLLVVLTILLFDLLPLFISVLISSKILNGKFVVENRNKTINLSLIFFIILIPAITICSTFLISIPFFSHRIFLAVMNFSIFYMISSTMYVEVFYLALFGFCALLLLFDLLNRKYIVGIRVKNYLDRFRQISMPSKTAKFLKIVLISIFSLILLYFALGAVFIKDYSAHPAKDARIISSISQISGPMVDFYQKEGNYDNFNCGYQDITMLCQEIDKNYGEENGKEPIIIHSPLHNSQAVCLYSPLNHKVENKQTWFCADNLGHAHITIIDPAISGCSIAGGAKCSEQGIVYPD